MNIHRHMPITKSLLLKLCSLMLGYALWYTLSSSTTCSHTMTIPIYCYNESENHHIETPESMHLTLKAPRSLMRLIDFESVAVHIDAHTLHEGRNYIALSSKDLLLPQEIAVSHYTPLLVIDTQA